MLQAVRLTAPAITKLSRTAELRNPMNSGQLNVWENVASVFLCYIQWRILTIPGG